MKDVKTLLEGMGGSLTYEVLCKWPNSPEIEPRLVPFTITTAEATSDPYEYLYDALVQAAYAKALSDMKPVVEALRVVAVDVSDDGYCSTCDECNSENPCEHRIAKDALALYERLEKE